jgi:hypothetical protein
MRSLQEVYIKTFWCRSICPYGHSPKLLSVFRLNLIQYKLLGKFRFGPCWSTVKPTVYEIQLVVNNLFLHFVKTMFPSYV